MKNIILVIVLLGLVGCSHIDGPSINTTSSSDKESPAVKCAKISHSINLMTEKIVAGTYENGVIDETHENTKYTQDAQTALYTISSMYTIYKISGCGN